MASKYSATGVSYYKSAANNPKAGAVLYALDLVSDLPSPIKEEMFVTHLWSMLGLGEQGGDMPRFEKAA